LRTTRSFTVTNPVSFRRQLLSWAQGFRETVFLDSNGHGGAYHTHDAVLAADAFTSIVTDAENGFDKLDAYQRATADWIFGYLSYDLKNDTEDLVSENADGCGFPDLFFFQPKKLFFLEGTEVKMAYLRVCEEEMEADLRAILGTADADDAGSAIQVRQRIPRDQYLSKVETMLGHIRRGDIYEANFCMEFFAEAARLDPVPAYHRLNALSQPPFAAFLKSGSSYVLSASPERYLKKEGEKIISQPIKGTAPRFAAPAEDEASKARLAADPKERAENVMIVDLVRNDLSRTAAKGSVRVEELCGIHSFRQVHHMISTVVSEIPETVSPVGVLRTTFPMGSMTGAPKVSAMQIIEALEESRRSVYSGALGYFTPEGDFDFNVVIRSILYQEKTGYVSFSVGSAITSLADPEREYDECLLKAAAMLKALGSTAT
jgi:para-aminobenzoate synthetase component I